MRLGEFRTKTRDLENKQLIQIAFYDETRGVTIYDVDIDIATDSTIFLRLDGEAE